MTSEDTEELDSFPAALHAKVAAAKAGWDMAVCARHAVTPEYYWRHDTDCAALHAAKALTALAERYLERAVVAARADGLSWGTIGEALGEPDPMRAFATAVDGWTAELAMVRARARGGDPVFRRPGASLRFDWVVDTPWWAEALREWLVNPTNNPLDNAGNPIDPNRVCLWRVADAEQSV